MTMRPESCVFHTWSAWWAAAIPAIVTATTTARNDQVSNPRHPHAIGTATTVPQVPGATGEYPAPPAVAIARAMNDVTASRLMSPGLQDVVPRPQASLGQ